MVRSGLLYLSIAALSLAALPHADACTTFSLRQTQGSIVANSFDWDVDNGLVVINKRNQTKSAFALLPGTVPATWQSKYGSITYNQYGREQPNAGMNEAGLVIEIMWLDSSEYPKSDGSPAVSELQWIQFHLDRFDNVGDVVRSAGDVKIRDIYAKVHYLVCDKTGDCATIEFIKGEMVSHVGCEMLVNALTNDTYDESVAYLRKQKEFGGTALPPEAASSTSLDRFVRASLAVRAYHSDVHGDPIPYAFNVLSSVAQGNRSKWNVVFDRKDMRLHFRTFREKAVKSLDLKKFDFSCRTPSKILDMNAAGLSGDVTAKFTDYSTKANFDLIKLSFGQLGLELPPGAMEGLAAYPGTFGCKEPKE